MASVSPGMGCCCFEKGGFGCSWRTSAEKRVRILNGQTETKFQVVLRGRRPVLTEACMKRLAHGSTRATQPSSLLGSALCDKDGAALSSS
jgi:hypothetical protein